MTRKDFSDKIIRYLLFALLAIIALISGRNANVTADCNSCPGKGICKGETDCQEYSKIKQNG